MKLICTLLLSSLVLPLAYAMPTTGGKVVNVKQWATNNASVNFRVTPKAIAYPEDNSKYARVITKTEAQQGIVGTPKTYTANSAFDFYNESNQAETVIFNLNVCIDNNDSDYGNHYQSQCGYYSEVVSVPAHDYYSKNIAPELITKFDKAGVYHLTSTAFYTSQSSQKRFISNASADITVTA